MRQEMTTWRSRLATNFDGPVRPERHLQMVGATADGAILNVVLLLARRQIQRHDNDLAAGGADIVGLLRERGEVRVGIVAGHASTIDGSRGGAQ